MKTFFTTILYAPLFNLLIFLYEYVTFEDIGLAVIALTIIVRLVLFPFFHASISHQTKLRKLDPKIKQIQRDHKNNKERQVQELMSLYKEHNVNPLSGILLIFIQLPILIALYRVFLVGLSNGSFDLLYSFVARPEMLHTSLLGLINLKERNILMVGFAALLQYIQGRMMVASPASGSEGSSVERMGRQMVFLGPVITIAVLANLPSVIALYWTVSTLFSIAQQAIVAARQDNYGTDSGKNKNNA